MIVPWRWPIATSQEYCCNTDIQQLQQTKKQTRACRSSPPRMRPRRQHELPPPRRWRSSSTARGRGRGRSSPRARAPRWRRSESTSTARACDDNYGGRGGPARPAPTPVALHDLLHARCSAAFSPRACCSAARCNGPAAPPSAAAARCSVAPAVPAWAARRRARRLSPYSIWPVEEADPRDYRSDNTPVTWRACSSSSYGKWGHTLLPLTAGVPPAARSDAPSRRSQWGAVTSVSGGRREGAAAHPVRLPCPPAVGSGGAAAVPSRGGERSPCVRAWGEGGDEIRRGGAHVWLFWTGTSTRPVGRPVCSISVL
jgi:hypothetical protein